MRTIGFRKENDANVVKEKYYDDINLSSGQLINGEQEKNKIIEYLTKSDYIFAITLALYDKEYYIGPYMIFSDGEWLWPSYFSYNLIKQEYLNEDFLNHLRQKNYTTKSLTEKQKKEATVFLEREILNI